MLLVEQFAAMALDVAGYAYVLENGRVRFQGPARNLKSDPAVRSAYPGGH
jgi:branched-chain amino acid transport system ATP-binding protein